MDRLICGDVGFGKTEVALRAAFVAAMNGRQVAVVVPTTLLARQHTKTFAERFRGFPVHVAQASRLISPSELTRVKKKLVEGGVDIVIGTHALLGKTIKFRDLGLVIVDEEQHFGVAHKEKLKQRARNRRRSEGDHMDLGAQLLELLLVGHAEMLLFVDDHKTEIAELDGLAEQRVSADHDVDAALDQFFLYPRQLRR